MYMTQAPRGRASPLGPGRPHGPGGQAAADDANCQSHERGFPGTPRPRAAGGARRVRAAILALLAEQPMHGYQIMRELGERSGGVWRPSPGSIYPTLQQLEDEELVRPEERRGRPARVRADRRRTRGRRTGRGRRPALDEVGDEGDARRSSCATSSARWWPRRARPCGPARAADRTVKDVLRDTRRKLYRILAEDSPEPAESKESHCKKGNSPLLLERCRRARDADPHRAPFAQSSAFS